jgi:lipopolysaccharide export system permease protein
VLLLTFLSNQLVRYLAIAAAGKLSGWIVLKLMLLQTPHLLGLLLPLGLFLSLLLAYGRLNADNEMTVLAASGVSREYLLGTTLRFALIITCIVAVFTLWLDPYFILNRNKLLAEANAASALQTMLPGRFEEARKGKLIFYVENVSLDRKRMHNVFVAEQATQSKDNIPVWTVMAAADGYQQVDPHTGEVYFVTTKGHRYEGQPGQKDYTMLGYEKYAVKIKERSVDIDNSDEGSLSTWKLWQHRQKPGYSAELQWRLSMPLSCLLLAWLAISLSANRPRQGRYALILPAILLYITYANLLFVSRSWIAEEKVAGIFGVIWVHLLLLSLTSLLWWQLPLKQMLKKISVSFKRA